VNCLVSWVGGAGDVCVRDVQRRALQFVAKGDWFETSEQFCGEGDWFETSGVVRC